MPLPKFPAPWKILDPNGAYWGDRKKFGYRPIYICDVRGNRVLYSGDASKEPALEIAKRIVSAINSHEKAYHEMG